jgi:predicted component of type VI protein secretion system
MTVTALMIFLLVSQLLVTGYLLYSFNDVEREARKRNADLRAHIDRVIADLESRLREGGSVRDESSRKRAALG